MILDFSVFLTNYARGSLSNGLWDFSSRFNIVELGEPVKKYSSIIFLTFFFVIDR